MASRLYDGTKELFFKVLKVLVLLGLGSVMPALCVNLVCVYVCGLILLDKHQTNCRIARWLPARCHDALNRLLRVMGFGVESLMALLVKVAKGLGEGYLILDDVVLEKYGQACRFVGYCWSTSRRGVVRGIHVVVLVWCSIDGRYRIPVGFCVWKPEKRCKEEGQEYKTKKELGKELIVWVRRRGLKFSYICFDSWYSADWLFKWLTKRGIVFVSELSCSRHVIYRGKEQRVDELAKRLSYRVDGGLGKEVAVVRVELPCYGQIKLVSVREAKGAKEGSAKDALPSGVKEGAEYEYEYIVTNEVYARGKKVVQRKKGRWVVETVFRDEKQYGGLGACRCWVEEAVRRHVCLSLLCFVVLQWLRERGDETLGQVKERWQLEMLKQGQREPAPLRGREKVTLEVTA